MAKPKIVLTSVGILIVHKLAENEKRLIARLCEQDFSKPSGLQNTAPELTSLSAIGVGPRR